MTETTDIKALREALCKLKSVEGLRTLAAELIGQLEAERQRADDLQRINGIQETTIEVFRHKELAALKCDQVPVVSELIPEGMKYSSALPEFVGDSNEISSYRCWIHGNTRKVATQEQAYADAKAACELFTAPQKQVVCFGDIAIHENLPIVGALVSYKDVVELIEAAGGIVKDGE